MALFRDSRYFDVTSREYTDSDGNKNVALDWRTFKNIDFEDSVLHVAKAGDRFDLLADLYYGESTLWWLIAEANPTITFPLDLTPGTEVAIPSLSNI